MDPEDAKPPGSETPAATPAPSQAPAPGLTAEAVQAMIAEAVRKAHDAGAAAARRAAEGKSPKATRAEAPATETAPDDPDTRLRLRDAFDDATAEMTLTKGQKKRMRDAFYATRMEPSGVDEWVRSYAEDSGWSAAKPNMNNTPADPPKPTGAPASNGGAPASVVATRGTDVSKWTDEDIMRFYEEKGGHVTRNADDGRLNFTDLRNMPIHRLVRDMAKSRLSTMRILLGPQRGRH